MVMKNLVVLVEVVHVQQLDAVVEKIVAQLRNNR
jgi:hypothetical protein